MDEFKVIVAGGRDFDNYPLLERKLNHFLKYISADVVVVSGCAQGADSLGERYAKKHHLKVKKFPAEWNKYGRRAGYIRNVQMANVADALVSFWDGKSAGTSMMIGIAKKNGLPIRVVKY